MVSFFFIFLKFSYAIDYFFDKSSVIDRDEPRIKTLIYYGLQGNKIYLCSKSIQMADQVNALINIFLTNHVQYELECNKAKISGSNYVLVSF